MSTETDKAALLGGAGTSTNTVTPLLEVSEPPEKKPLWENPYAKGALALGVTSVGFAVVAAIFAGGGATKETTPPVEEVKTKELEKEVLKDDEEVNQLKVETALGDQAEALGRIGSGSPSVKPLPTPEPKSLPAPPPPPPVPAAVQPAQPKTTASSSRSQVLDPEKQWAMLASIGSYGGINESKTEGGVAPQQLQAQVVSNQVVNNQGEIPVLTGRVTGSLKVGGRFRGVLESPVAWEGSLSGEEKFLVRLLEPITNSEKEEVWPMGTTLLVKGTSSPTGTVRLVALTAILASGEERAIPDGAVVVRAAAGLPLEARNTRDKGPEIGSLDTGLFALAGAAKAAEILNRPKQATSIAGTTGISTSITQPEPNLLAGVIEGGAGILTQQISQRNQIAIREALTRPNLWVVQAGTPVEIFITRSFSL